MAIRAESREFEHEGKAYRVVDGFGIGGLQVYRVIEADADLGKHHWRSSFVLGPRMGQADFDAQKVKSAESIREARLQESSPYVEVA